MLISISSSRATSIKKWSDAHKPASNDDDTPGRGTPIAVCLPILGEAMIVPPEELYRPWQVPGVGTAF